MTLVLCHVSGPLNVYDGNEILMEQSLEVHVFFFFPSFKTDFFF